MSTLIPISVTVLTKNSEKHLKRVLEALRSFEEVIVADTGSTDNTLLIAASFPNVCVFQLPFDGFGATHNAVSQLAKLDWILSVDSDEELSLELVKEIASLSLDSNTTYAFPRKNFYRGTWVKTCGWYPDRVVRLYNRQVTRFSDNKVHEGVLTKGLKVVDLKASAFHTPYESVTDFLRKMQMYTTLFAEQNRGIKKGSLIQAILHAKMAFFKAYILKRGILQGGVGFEISFYNAVTAFYKYLKLREYEGLK